MNSPLARGSPPCARTRSAEDERGAAVVAEMLGRGGEAAALARFLERVPNGPVGLVIEGEPGIGKTTVWSEAVRRGGERGYRVLQARPAEAESELSYAALGDLIGDVLDEVSGDLPTPQLRALEVALLRREADAPADPHTGAIALVGVLTSLAADRPLVVAVDDVQWLDRASERALEFAARRLPTRLGIVVARRTVGGHLLDLAGVREDSQRDSSFWRSVTGICSGADFTIQVRRAGSVPSIAGRSGGSLASSARAPSTVRRPGLRAPGRS